eukprot:snap_masked-scaffold_38-processed-gene-2.43-mRNA-1 protein AED:1.00 eAED:1.00 QI:0/-1/0/0/-1/1/1/0/157
MKEQKKNGKTENVVSFLNRPNRYEKKRKLQNNEGEDRYKMVKFFERKKIERKIGQLEKKLVALNENQTEEKNKIEEELNEWIRKRNYVRFYPKSQKYVSILKGNLTDVQKEIVEKNMKRCSNFATFLERKNLKQQRKEEMKEEIKEKIEAEEETFFL